MNQLKIFEYKKQEVKTILKDGEPYFCLGDICKILELDNSSQVKKRLNPKGVFLNDTLTSGGIQKLNFISESNLYKTIFQSKTTYASTFQDWMCEKVIPDIRKHGAYVTPEKLDELIDNPDLFIKLLTSLKNEKHEKQKLLAENSVMKPKAEYFDELVDRNLLTNFRDTAKTLKVKETDFIQFLLERKYIYRNSKGKLLPYAEQNNNLFEIKETMNQKINWTGVQTLITPKGRETFRLLLKQNSCMETEYENSQNDDDFES